MKVKADVWQKNGILVIAYTGEKGVMSMGRLVINGEEIYELDVRCLKEKKLERDKEMRRRIQEEKQNVKTKGQRDFRS